MIAAARDVFHIAHLALATVVTVIVCAAIIIKSPLIGLLVVILGAGLIGSVVYFAIALIVRFAVIIPLLAGISYVIVEAAR